MGVLERKAQVKVLVLFIYFGLIMRLVEASKKIHLPFLRAHYCKTFNFRSQFSQHLKI